jgi:hypothetical protein
MTLFTNCSRKSASSQHSIPRYNVWVRAVEKVGIEFSFEITYTLACRFIQTGVFVDRADQSGLREHLQHLVRPTSEAFILISLSICRAVAHPSRSSISIICSSRLRIHSEGCRSLISHRVPRPPSLLRRFPHRCKRCFGVVVPSEVGLAPVGDDVDAVSEVRRSLCSVSF